MQILTRPGLFVGVLGTALGLLGCVANISPNDSTGGPVAGPAGPGGHLQIADILTPWAPSGLQLVSDYDLGHSLGHWVSAHTDPANVPKWELEMKGNRAWRMGLVKLIADGLNSPDFLEGGVPLLDNSLIFYSNEFSTGGIHCSTDGAYMLLGGAGGHLKTGRFVELHKARLANAASLEAGSTATTNYLYITILNALGAPDTEFGDMQFAKRKGPISELLA